MVRALDGFGGLYLLFSKNTLGLPVLGSVCCAQAIPSVVNKRRETEYSLAVFMADLATSLHLEPIQFRDQPLEALLAVNLNQPLFLVRRRHHALQLRYAQVRAAGNPHAAVGEFHAAHEA